jgi:drug/metabolite transporter (DMT)-like permease
MLMAASMLPVMNGLVQLLSRDYHAMQIVWARITFHLLLIVLAFAPRSGLSVVIPRRPWLQAGRSLCQVSSTAFYFTAVAHVPLAKATAINFIAPFITALLAWPMLGERPEARRLLAVALAFCGVLVAIRPEGEAFQPISLLLLGSAGCYALYQVLTRKVAPFDKAETSAVWSALLGAVILSALLPLFWITPKSLADVIAFVALGALGGAGHYCIARAFSYGQAAVIAPFQYWQIIGAVVMGVIVTGAWPDGGTWLGAAIIVSAGILLAVQEARRR